MSNYTDFIKTGDALKTDGTAGRVLRGAYVRIEDGTDAATLKCSVVDRWNGDAVGYTDNIAKGGTTGAFDLSADGKVLKVWSSSLIADVLYAVGIVVENRSGIDLVPDVAGNTDHIRVTVKHSNNGTLQDMTNLVNAGRVFVDITYITDA